MPNSTPACSAGMLLIGFFACFAFWGCDCPMMVRAQPEIKIVANIGDSKIASYLFSLFTLCGLNKIIT
jgi:hypothetical protein